MTMLKHKTREDWLSEAARTMIKILFDDQDIPAYRVACGLPSKKAFSANNRTLGQCWSATASMDEHFEIFISPTLAEPVKVLGVLVHEMIHAIVGLKAGHKGPFKHLAKAVGLEGKMTATHPSKELTSRLNDLAEDLGGYPHAELTSANDGKKKQGTRLIKAMCDTCEYVIRTTSMWIETGLPTCHCGGNFRVNA